MAMLETESLTKRYPSVSALDCASRLNSSRESSASSARTARARARSSRSSSASSPQPSGRRRRAPRLRCRHPGPELRQFVGYMPEHDCLPLDMTATEFVAHMAQMSGLPTRRRPRAHRRDPPPRRPLRRALPRDPRLLHRHEAAREARPGARPRPAHAPPRRTDQRPRPRRPRRHARPRPPHRHRVRHRDHHVLPPARRNRARLRPPRRHRWRQARSVRRRSRRSRRPPARSSSKSRPAPCSSRSACARTRLEVVAGGPQRPRRPRRRPRPTTSSATPSSTSTSRSSASNSGARPSKTSSARPRTAPERRRPLADEARRAASTTLATAATKANGRAAPCSRAPWRRSRAGSQCDRRGWGGDARAGPPARRRCPRATTGRRSPLPGERTTLVEGVDAAVVELAGDRRVDRQLLVRRLAEEVVTAPVLLAHVAQRVERLRRGRTC